MLDYDKLLQRTDAPAGSSWGLFGSNDELGTLNFINDLAVRAAAATVRKGSRFNLDLPLDAFETPLFLHRRNPAHTIFSNAPHHRDDYVDGLYLQASSQVDGLRHMRHPLYAFYNGVSAERVAVGDPTLGVNRIAETAVAGRGLLLDLERHLRRRGRAIDHLGGEAFAVDLLEEVCRAQGCEPRPGDILMVRTGWLKHYFEERTPAQRAEFPARPLASGLRQSHDTLRWLWNQRFSIVAFDNPGVEALPAVADSPFHVRDAKGGRPSGGLMHPSMIGLLGMTLGELWDLEALGLDCARDGRYECLVTVKPLNLVGGVGSPANALALK